MEFNLIIWIFSLTLIKGQTLPEHASGRTTVCDGSSLRGSCPSGEVIAVKSVQYGTKATSSDCDYDAGDCLLQYNATAQQAACSGKPVCGDVTIAQADTSSCGAPYPNPGLNDYLTMDYYCVPETRIGTFSSASAKQTGSALYLTNPDYPNPIRAEDTALECSVETTSCSSHINVYSVHLELSDAGLCNGTQTLQLEDKRKTETYTCLNNTIYNITLMKTSASNYLRVKLNNPARKNIGKIWVGFEATQITAPIEISCPVQNQTICMDCPILTNFSNGTVTTPGGRSTAQKAHYVCNLGYSLVGNDTRVCLETGQWSDEEPTCQIKECQLLNNPENGKVTTDAGLTVGQNATYKCDPGYEISGGTSRTCQVNAEWSGDEPTCVQIECPELPKPENGNVSTEGGLTVGQNATYTCNYGYKMNGDRWRTCQLDRIWSGTAPNCSEIVCPSLSPPSNGSVTVEGSSVGATASYNCSSNYELGGDATRTCLPTGAWNGTAPKCVPKTCPEPTSPEHGRVVFGGVEIGQSANYTCSNGYILDGDETRICRGSYTWSGSEPICNARELGNNCTTVEDCSGATPGATCDASICVCAAHYVRDGNLCTAPAKEPEDENQWIKWLIIGIAVGVCVIIIVVSVTCYIQKGRQKLPEQQISDDQEKYRKQNYNNLNRTDSNETLNEEKEKKPDRQSKEYIKLQHQQHITKENPNQEDKDKERNSTNIEKTPNDIEHAFSRSGGEKLEDVQPKIDVNSTIGSTVTEGNYFPNTEKNEGRSPDAIISHLEGAILDKTGIQTKTAIAADFDNVLIEPIDTKIDIKSEEFLTRNPEVKENSNITDEDESGAKRASERDKINDEHLKPDGSKLDDAESENNLFNTQGSTKTQARTAGPVTEKKSSKDTMTIIEAQVETYGIGVSLDEQFSDTGTLIDKVTKALIRSASMAERDIMTRTDVLGFKIDEEWSKGIVTATREVVAAVCAMCTCANALAKNEAKIDIVTIEASAIELKKSMNRLVIAYKVENDTQSNAMKVLKETCNTMNKVAEKLVSSAKQTQSRKTNTENLTVDESDFARAKKKIEVTANLQRREKDLEDAQKAYQAVNKEQSVAQNREDRSLQFTEL